MRGLPPFQALLLLFTLAVLGFAGSHYIGMGMGSERGNGMGSSNNRKPPPVTPTCGDRVGAEIELVFSSPPLSYTLTEPSATGGEDKVVIKSSGPTENPSYGTVELVSHELTTYWLDVVWPEDAEDGAHHFVQIHISPNHGESQSFCFFSSIKDMNETFEYNTGDHHHE